LKNKLIRDRFNDGFLNNSINYNYQITLFFIHLDYDGYVLIQHCKEFFRSNNSFFLTMSIGIERIDHI